MKVHKRFFSVILEAVRDLVRTHFEDIFQSSQICKTIMWSGRSRVCASVHACVHAYVGTGILRRNFCKDKENELAF